MPPYMIYALLLIGLWNTDKFLLFLFPLFGNAAFNFLLYQRHIGRPLETSVLGRKRHLARMAL